MRLPPHLIHAALPQPRVLGVEARQIVNGCAIAPRRAPLPLRARRFTVGLNDLLAGALICIRARFAERRDDCIVTHQRCEHLSIALNDLLTLRADRLVNISAHVEREESDRKRRIRSLERFIDQIAHNLRRADGALISQRVEMLDGFGVKLKTMCGWHDDYACWITSIGIFSRSHTERIHG